MKKENWIKLGVFVGVATAVGVAGHYWLKKHERNGSEVQELLGQINKINATPEVVSKSSTSKSSIGLEDEKVIEKVASEFPIQLGDQGDHITQIQANLLKLHGWADVTMGTYDTKTEQRVQRFWKVDQITKEVYQKHIKKPVKLQ